MEAPSWRRKLYSSAARDCLADTLRWRRNSAVWRNKPIAAVAGSAFWHSLLALDAKSRPLTPVFMWADTRSTPDARALREEASENAIRTRTGCMLRAPFWPAKLRWLRRTQPTLFKKTAQWVSPADWVFRELFGTALTSHSMASGTGLYNLRTAKWDAALCDLVRVHPDQFDRLSNVTTFARATPTELHGVPVFPAIGDGAASNLGSGADRAGHIALTIGTSGAVRQILPRRSTAPAVPFGLFRFVVDEARVVLGGAVSNGGNLHQWCLRELNMSPARAEQALDRRAASTDRLTVLPFWVNERAPSWPEGLRGTIAGFTAATSAEEILRATTTATYYRLAEILAALPGPCHEVIVSGGVLHSRGSLEILADAIGHDLRISSEMESSLRGAAVLALEKLGHEPKALPPGDLVRHRPALAAAHALRRQEQTELEQRLR